MSLRQWNSLSERNRFTHLVAFSQHLLSYKIIVDAADDDDDDEFEDDMSNCALFQVQPAKWNENESRRIFGSSKS
jgi:hypothetical protein